MPQRPWVFDHGTMFAACALGVARVALLVEDLHPVFFFGMQMKCDATTSCLFDVCLCFCVFVFLLVCYFPRCWTFLTLRSGRRFSMNSPRADECGERLTVAKGFSTSSENQLGWRNVESFLRILVCLLMCCCCALFLHSVTIIFGQRSSNVLDPNLPLKMAPERCAAFGMLSLICLDINTPKRMSGSRDSIPGVESGESGVASLFFF